MAKTPLRNIRVDDELWEAFGEATAAAGTDRTAALTAYMRWYVRDFPARPGRDDQGDEQARAE